MRTKINKSMWVILPCILLFLISCATRLKQVPYTPEEVRVRVDLGRIGIVSASFQPEVRFQKPMTKGAAALQGAAVWALVTIVVGAYVGGGYGGVLGIGVAPVSAVVGAY
jgi:hypothetical protein